MRHISNKKGSDQASFFKYGAEGETRTLMSFDTGT